MERIFAMKHIFILNPAAGKQNALAELEAQLKESRISIMLSQIQPHGSAEPDRRRDSPRTLCVHGVYGMDCAHGDTAT